MTLIIKMLGWLTATVRFCLFYFFYFKSTVTWKARAGKAE